LAYQVLITRLDPADEQTLRGCHRVFAAAHDVDDPHGPPEPYAAFAIWVTTGWGDTPGEAWAARDEPGGAVTGFYRINLPDKVNLDSAWVFAAVHPARRRQGLGSELLRHAAARAAAEGRTVLRGTTFAGTAGAKFAGHAGATAGLVSLRRVLHLRELPDGLVAGQRAQATAAAAGYTLVSWAGGTPPEYWEGLAGVMNAFGDAPADEGYERESWTADRVRDEFDIITRWDAIRRYSVAALHAETGEMAGLTQVYTTLEEPAWAQQGLTAVARAHRGHRIGLLVKTAMLDWLATAEPGIEHITTDNADSNQYMIAINELLGFEIYPPPYQWHQMPTAEVR
jgi:RimJ/RimL family protein N-acetyltransferase